MYFVFFLSLSRRSQSSKIQQNRCRVLQNRWFQFFQKKNTKTSKIRPKINLTRDPRNHTISKKATRSNQKKTCLPNVFQIPANSLPTVCQMSAKCLPNVFHMSSKCLPTNVFQHVFQQQKHVLFGSFAVGRHLGRHFLEDIWKTCWAKLGRTFGDILEICGRCPGNIWETFWDTFASHSSHILGHFGRRDTYWANFGRILGHI